MVGLIDDILDYSKIDAGRLELQLQPVDVAELIRQNLEFNSILANKKGIKLRFENEGVPPPLKLDSQRIQQVFNNLISNALKFSRGWQYDHSHTPRQRRRGDNRDCGRRTGDRERRTW